MTCEQVSFFFFFNILRNLSHKTSWNIRFVIPSGRLLPGMWGRLFLGPVLQFFHRWHHFFLWFIVQVSAPVSQVCPWASETLIKLNSYELRSGGVGGGFIEPSTSRWLIEIWRVRRPSQWLKLIDVLLKCFHFFSAAGSIILLGDTTSNKTSTWMTELMDLVEKAKSAITCSAATVAFLSARTTPVSHFSSHASMSLVTGHRCVLNNLLTDTNLCGPQTPSSRKSQPSSHQSIIWHVNFDNNVFTISPDVSQVPWWKMDSIIPFTWQF